MALRLRFLDETANRVGAVLAALSQPMYVGGYTFHLTPHALENIPGLLATVYGGSKPYDIRLGRDQNIYCTCPDWKYQRKHPHDRICKHMTMFAQGVKELTEGRAA